MKRLNSKLVKVLSGLAMSILASNAMASAILVLSDSTTGGGLDVIVMDNTAAGVATPMGITTHADGSATVGVVNFNGGTGGVFDVNVTTGISKPIIGPLKIDLNSVNVNSSGAGQLVLGFSDIGFVTSTPGTSHTFVGRIGGTTTGTVSSAWGVDSGNQYFVGQAGAGSQGPFGPGAFSDTASISRVMSNPFSISQVVTITHNGPGAISSFDMEVSVPEPAVLGLLGIGLLGVGLAKRRKAAA